MTPIDRLLLQAAAAQIELAQNIAKAAQAYTDNRPQLVLEQIEATLDSQTAEEMDGDLPSAADVLGIMK